MTDVKPIKVWLTPMGPNPWKVILVLEELGIPYEIIHLKNEDVKKEPFATINPNGRIPAIEDPNTGLTLWESGAIVQYLVEQYDTEKKLTHDGLIERNEERQWLMFQMSGQGPYFGQAVWFTYLHSEKLPSAAERYVTEAKRILGVLETQLERQAQKHETEELWLVGDKMTYADLSFVPWNARLDVVVGVKEEEVFEGCPRVRAWHARMVGREAWVKSMALRDRLLAGPAK